MVLLPYRIVLMATNPNGSQEYHLRVGGPHANTVSSKMLSGDVVEIEEVATWFASGWLSPLEWELNRLAQALNIMRVTKHRLEAYSSINIGAIGRALSTIENELPKLIYLDREMLASSDLPESIRSIRLGALAAFEALYAATRRPAELLCDPIHEHPPWQADALWIAAFLKMVAGRQEKRIGFSTGAKAGPAIELIHSALERVGTAIRTKDAVVKAIRRRTAWPAVTIARVSLE